MTAPANRCLCAPIDAHIWKNKNQFRVQTHMSVLNYHRRAFRFICLHIDSSIHV